MDGVIADLLADLILDPAEPLLAEALVPRRVVALRSAKLHSLRAQPLVINTVIVRLFIALNLLGRRMVAARQASRATATALGNAGDHAGAVVPNALLARAADYGDWVIGTHSKVVTAADISLSLIIASDIRES